MKYAWIIIAVVLLLLVAVSASADDHEHTWSNWETVIEETTFSTGLRRRYCTENPSHTYEEVIPMLPSWDTTEHIWDEWETVSAATADMDGVEKRVCMLDDSHVIYRVIPALGHNFVETDVSIENATNQYDGSHHFTQVTTYTCTDCGMQKQVEEMVKQAHVFSTEETYRQKIQVNACLVCGARSNCHHDGATSYFSYDPMYSWTYTDNGDGATHTITQTTLPGVALKCEQCGKILAYDVEETVSYVMPHGDPIYTGSAPYTCECGFLIEGKDYTHEHEWEHREGKLYENFADQGWTHLLYYRVDEWDYCSICHSTKDEVISDALYSVSVPHTYYLGETVCLDCGHVNKECSHAWLNLNDKDSKMTLVGDNGDGTHRQVTVQSLNESTYQCQSCKATLKGYPEPYYGFTYLAEQAESARHTYDSNNVCTVCGAVKPEKWPRVPVVYPSGEVTVPVNEAIFFNPADSYTLYDKFEMEVIAEGINRIETFECPPFDGPYFGLAYYLPGEYHLRFRGWIGDEVSDWSEETVVTAYLIDQLPAVHVENLPDVVFTGSTHHLQWNDVRINGDEVYYGYRVMLSRYNPDGSTTFIRYKWALFEEGTGLEIDYTFDVEPGRYMIFVIPQTESGYIYTENYQDFTVFPVFGISSRTWVKGYKVDFINYGYDNIWVEWATALESDGSFTAEGSAGISDFRPEVAGDIYVRYAFETDDGIWIYSDVRAVTVLEETLKLPENLERIESGAFVGIEMKAYILPETVTEIAFDAFDSTAVLIVSEDQVQMMKDNWFDYVLK